MNRWLYSGSDTRDTGINNLRALCACCGPRRHGTVLAALLVIALVSLAGCGSEPAEPAEAPTVVEDSDAKPVAELPTSLAGTSWLLEALGGGDEQVESLPGVQTTLGFLADRYGGNGGCNFYVGVYNQDGAGLRMETPARTGGTCPDAPEGSAQESVFMAALATVTSHAIVGGKLEMYSSADQLLLTMEPFESVPLQGTVWSLQFVNVETQWEETLAGGEITMQIDGNELSGSAGCNDYSATVTEEAGALTISNLSFTEMACAEPQGVMEQESLYLSLLEQASLLRQFPVSLELRDIEGRPLLLYGAAQ